MIKIKSLQKLYLKHKIATEMADGEISKFIQEENMLLISDIFKAQKDDLDYLIKLGKELKSQDNLGTRKPLVFRIKDVETVTCYEGQEDFKLINIKSVEGYKRSFNINEVEYAKNFLKNEYEYIYYPEKVPKLLEISTDIDKIINFCDIYNFEYEVFYYANESTYKGEFLTRKAAREHLEKFNHRYSDQASIYCDCAAENEEITKLTEVIERIYEMNKGCDEDIG